LTPPDLRSIGSATPIPAEGSRYGGPAQATFPGRNGRIAYSVGPIFPQEPPAPSQVFTVNPDGSGRRIAFSSNLGGGDLRLYTINRDGSDQRPVFDDQPGYNDLFPGYTPDGRRLVFQRCLPDDGVCAIYSVGLDGGGLRALTQFKPGPNEANDYWPTVAPDGRIAFGRFGAGGSPPSCTSCARTAAGCTGCRPAT
jgi:dipeptidyl aminopeptidase/acylaminoacyl peptidase